MKQLWAPWRIQYIKHCLEEKSCFLCKALKEKKKDRENFVLYRSRHCFAILNKFPYNNGHLMVAPNRHTSKLGSLKDEEILDLMRVATKMERALKYTMHPHGFNIGFNIGRCSGAGLLTHMHLHIVPRWTGDTSFMPVLSDCKVIPQMLKDSYNELKKYIDEKFRE